MHTLTNDAGLAIFQENPVADHLISRSKNGITTYLVAFGRNGQPDDWQTDIMSALPFSKSCADAVTKRMSSDDTTYHYEVINTASMKA